MNGVLNVHKSSSFTSHDVVAVIRRILREKQIGHLGTLDPLATGVLPLAIGMATRLVEYASFNKEYRTVCLLGKTTDSCDVTGKTIHEKPTDKLSMDQVRAAVMELQRIQEQVPPMVSAVKLGGKKLYELARQGVTIERKPRSVQVFEIEILALELPRVTFRVVCSPGTYMRVLCERLGEVLGVGGCMEKLERTRVGPFGLESALTIEEIQKKVEAGNLSSMLLPSSSLAAHLRAVSLDLSLLPSLCLGQKLKWEESFQGPARVLNEQGRLCAIVEWEEGLLKPRKVFGLEGME